MNGEINNSAFFRTSDRNYMGCVTDNQSEIEVSVNFDSFSKNLRDPAKCYRIANELFSKMDEAAKNSLRYELKSCYFRADGRTYVLRPENNFILRIIVWACRFFKIIKNASKVYYTIEPSLIPSWIWKPKLEIKTDNPPPIIKGFAEKMENARPYSDPFTTLSTTLFQIYEPHHSWKDIKDHPYRDPSFYEIFIDGSDNLVGKKISEKAATKEQRQKTLKIYRNYIIGQFGEYPLKRIETHYATEKTFSLNDMIERGDPLTPEIVYRINIGMSIIEGSDVRQLAKDLEEKAPLPLRIARKLGQNEIPRLDPNQPEDFQKLMGLLEISDEKIFTGRKIHGKITAWYTQGDSTLYKPWADQQEFLQTCQRIPGRSWECFFEDLTMILCKKHLHLTNPIGSKELFRVGVVIPAPRKANGPQYYYTVTSWIHNSRGIYAYTLEPACPGSDLPAIKLYRSTSSSPYSLDGASSFKNDFNPINSPGYEGSHYLEKEEFEFFKKRTIPVWVGYQLQAEKFLKEKNREAAYQNLLAANKTLQEEIAARYKRPTIKEFIRAHDSDFLKLIEQCRWSGRIGRFRSFHLLNNCLRHTVKNNEDESSQNVQSLKKFLHEFEEDIEVGKLAKHLLSWWNQKMPEPSIDEKILLEAMDRVNEDSWESWIQHLANYAYRIGENPDSKTDQNLELTGHSLGGACAQRFMVYYTASKGRIPLPGRTLSARVFDDPAINSEDNEAFLSFGNKHVDLLDAQGSKFAIIRRQEAGDIVPQSGETHLGSVKTVKEQKDASRWLIFDAAVQTASSKAKVPEIRDYFTAHARMFAGASPKYHGLKKLRQKLERIKNPTAEQRAALEEARRYSTPDYKLTYYDAITQWNFDHPGNQKTWAELKKLWKLPFWFNPIVIEQLRSFISAAGRSGLLIKALGAPNPEDDIAHGEWKNHRDPNGVLSVKNSL